MVPLFRNRADAGTRLARALDHLRGTRPLVIGLPRGGVPVAAVVAEALDGELDTLVVKKVGAPEQPELALGAVTELGSVTVNAEIVRDIGIGKEALRGLCRHKEREARALAEVLRGERPFPEVRGREVIVVDDGLATGATMRAAAQALREQGPARLIAAVPVGAAASCAELERYVDEVVCLATPSPFLAVGYHYASFEPTTEDEARRLLVKGRPSAPATRSRPRRA